MYYFKIILLIIPYIFITIGRWVKTISNIVIKLFILTYNNSFIFTRNLFHLIKTGWVNLSKNFILYLRKLKQKSYPVYTMVIYSGIRKRLKSVLGKNTKKSKQSKILPKNKAVKVSQTKPKARIILSQLGYLYLSCLKDALFFFRLKPIKLKYPRLPAIRLNRFKIKIPQSISKFRYRIFFPTPKDPIVVYPTPLLLAWRLKWFFAGVASTLVLVLIPVVIISWLQDLPNPSLLSSREIAVASKIYDRNGILLYQIYSDENRTPITLNSIPPLVQRATIAIEDKDFYNHQGFSLKAIIRAARETMLNKRLQGGSTITQQLIKSALLTPDITISRKVKELVLAFWTERIYTKSQILEMYLNQVPYGGTAWGIESASQTYFGKSVSQLNLAEAALLAGLPAAPSQYSPFGAHPELATMRQHEVIKRMLEEKYITPLQARDALAYEIKYIAPRSGILAPHFVMYVKNLLEQQFGTRLIEKGGLRIVTSLDMNIQQQAEEIVSNQIDSLQNLDVGNGAAVITRPSNGEILAMVGSRNYFDMNRDGNMNVTTALRQPGSSIKVVNYAAALEKGYTASSIIMDTPVAYRAAGSPAYAPVNYDGRYHGPVTFRSALANSYNIPAVKILAQIGVKTMIDKGREMGIDSWVDDNRFGLSLTLGGGEVTMLEMAEVYGTLASGGIHREVKPILKIYDYTGKVINFNNYRKPKRVLSAGSSFIISDILSDNQARSAAFGPRSSLVIEGKTVAVKTGTSNEKRDNWTIGYTPSYVVAVWVGNNDNTPMNPVLTSGVTGAAPIWHELMQSVLKDKPDEPFARPGDVVEVPCYNGKNEFFIKGTEPKEGRCRPTPTSSPTP